MLPIWVSFSLSDNKCLKSFGYRIDNLQNYNTYMISCIFSLTFHSNDVPNHVKSNSFNDFRCSFLIFNGYLKFSFDSNKLSWVIGRKNDL